MPSWQEKESVQSWRKLRDLMRCLAKGLAIMPENRYNKNDPVREHCEELVMNHAQYDQETGKPLDQSYLECGTAYAARYGSCGGFLDIAGLAAIDSMR